MTADIRGLPRPQSRACDIGAYEADLWQGTLFLLR
ncbi:MAG: choice-of-anchor Q domain-containing protein [Kiritimatiellia bacterium]